MTIHYLRLQTSIFQGLDWIPPATWGTAFENLERLTFGSVWLLAVLAPSVLLWILSLCGVQFRRPARSANKLFAGGSDVCTLLGIWLLFAWGGLMVISWLAQPVMLERYALPAAVPALLIPLIIAYRVDRRIPLVLMVVIAIATAPARLTDTRGPGFRELSMFLDDHVEPETGAVVLAIDGTVPSEWADMERLGFRYYPLSQLPIHELLIGADGVSLDSEVLRDPRALYVAMFRADPLPAIQAAGRCRRSFRLGDHTYSQLAFGAYRLLQVAPLPAGG